MNLRLIAFAALLPTVLTAQQAPRYQGERPPVSTATRGSAETAPSHQQRLYAPAETLVAPEKAQEVVEIFRAAYERLGKPRLIIAVNRELIDPGSGLRLTGRKEQVETTRTEVNSDMTVTVPAPGAAPQTQVNVAIGGAAGSGSTSMGAPGKGSSSTSVERTRADNTYTHRDRPAVTLADRQTVRDVERLFGRPLRIGGAQLADQRTVAQLIADEPVDRFIMAPNEAGRKDREALMRIADVVVEILISSRPLVVTGFSEDQTYSIPDIQATAIRLSDGAIIGQAAASDVIGKDRYAGRIVRTYDASDISEATALALMEDIALTTP